MKPQIPGEGHGDSKGIAQGSSYGQAVSHSTTTRPTFLSPQWKIGFAAVALTAAVGLPAWTWLGELTPDSDFYILMAQGRLDETVRPFANRLLHPAAARALMALGMSLKGAFAALSLASFLVLAWVAADLIHASTGKVWPAGVLLLSPLSISLFERTYLSDLFHAALLAVFLSLLRRKWTVAALAVLFLLHLTRESTVLTTFCLVLILVRSRRLGAAVGAAAAGVSGILVGLWWSAQALPNRHELGRIPYLAGKFVFNALGNYLGVPVFVDSLGNCEPVFSFRLPSWIAGGAIDQVGWCSFDPWAMVQTWGVLTTLFGVAPGVLAALAVVRRREPELSPLWIQLSLLYGLAAFILGPASGTWVERLAAYGWPAFWLGAPFLLARRLNPRADWLFLLAGLHLTASWLGWWVMQQTAPAAVGVALAVGLAANLTAAWLVGRALNKSIARPGGYRKNS